MKGKLPSDAALRKLIPARTGKGPRPRVSIWHGTADTVVAPANAEALLQQWRSVHQFAVAPDLSETIDGAERRSWRGKDGRAAIEVWTIPGLGHGTPIAPAKDKLGKAMPFMLAQEVSSTARIAGFFGLTGEAMAQVNPKVPTRKPVKQKARALAPPPPAEPPPPLQPVAGWTDSAPPPEPGIRAGLTDVLDKALPDTRSVNVTVKRIIDAALRRAGLR
jgi:hypothetical protein